MKRLLVGLIVLVASLTAQVTRAAGANVTLNGPKEVRPGQVFQVIVAADNLQDADTIRLNGSFSSNIISWIQAQPLTVLSNVSPGTSVNAKTGEFSYGCFSLSDGLTGQAKLVAITFKANNTGTATISLNKTSRVLSNGDDQAGSLGQIVIKVAPAAVPTEAAVPGPTVGALTVTSPSQPDQDVWYNKSDVSIRWRVSKPMQATYIGFDQSPAGPAAQLTQASAVRFTANKDGVWYAHVFVTYRDGTSDRVDYLIRIDRQPPHAVAPVVDQTEVRSSFPNSVYYGTTDDTSGIAEYRLFIDSNFVTSTSASTYPLTGFKVGRHTVRVEAFDLARNKTVGSTTFRIMEEPVVPVTPPVKVIPVERVSILNRLLGYWWLIPWFAALLIVFVIYRLGKKNKRNIK